MHNIRFTLRLMEDVRKAIAEDKLLDLRKELIESGAFN